MRNPLTFRIESWVGSVLVLVFSTFLVGIFLVAMKNFDSDAEILFSSATKLRTVSPQEGALIDGWIARGVSGLSVKEVGYRFIIKKYPDRPWLDR